MHTNVRAFINTLGGYQSVADRLRMGRTTLHGYIVADALPAKWYGPLLELATEKKIEPPSRALFSFEALPPEGGGVAV